MMVRDDAPVCGPPWSFPAHYCDARGQEATTIFDDGRTLRMVVRGVDFSGPDFERFEPPPGMEDAIGASFSLCDNSLADCVLEWEMPIGMVIGDRDIEGLLTARLDLGPPRPEPNRGIAFENLHLTLRWNGGVAESCGTHACFGDELEEIQARLPEGVWMRICFACAFSDYHPVGQGLSGGLACFRDNKAGYLSVRGKAVMNIWHTRTEYVQEWFSCPEFQRRAPGTGYRG